MRITICDDNIHFTDQLRACLEEYFVMSGSSCPEISIYHNGDALLRDTAEPDICFLDIEMPGPKGTYVGQRLKKDHPDVILFIITSHAQYLDDAMRFSAFRYLSKPLDKQRLFANLNDALTLWYSRNTQVLVETKDACVTLSSRDILYIESRNGATIVCSTKGDYESLQKMAYWVEKLPKSCFFASHRSFLINLQHVTEFDRNTIYFDNDKPPAYLTRKKYTEFKNAYLQYIESRRTAL